MRVARDVLTTEFLVWGVKRLVLNLLVSGIYTGFWSVAIYVWSWSHRKFRRTSWPSLATYVHNMWYFFLGIAQWTLWECAFVHFWASGKLPFLSDDKAFATPFNTARMILWTFGIPIWRGIHFYFSHRFIHMRCLYKYVHSLHHRFVTRSSFSTFIMNSAFGSLWQHIPLLLSLGTSMWNPFLVCACIQLNIYCTGSYPYLESQVFS